MRKLLISALAMCAPLLAQTCPSGLISVVDTIYGPVAVNGLLPLFQGAVTISTSTPLSLNGVTYGRIAEVINVASGAFNTCLVPNDAATPTGTNYRAEYAYVDAQGNAAAPWSESWYVNTSSVALSINQLRRIVAVAPTTISALSPLQYLPNVGQITIQQANGTQSGYLSNTDWTRFNSAIQWYSQAVSGGSGSESIVVPASVHGLAGTNLIALCDGVGECGQVNVASSGTVIVTSAVPWTGTLRIGTGKSYRVSFASATAISVSLPLHKLNGSELMACYDASGNQFGGGPLLQSSHDTGIGGYQGYDYAVYFATAATGYCVLMGF